MNAWEFYLIFAFGLASSFHCVSMCGPIVVSYSLPLAGKNPAGQAAAHIYYNLGRIITYAALGAISGSFGNAVGFLGDLAGYENVAAIIAGCLMFAAGLIMLGLVPAKGMQKFNPLLYTAKFLKPLGSKIASGSVSSKFGLGLMLGFLPCGLIYAALLKSMATGEILGGALTMAAFGLGTAGSLLAIGIFSTAFSFRLSRWGSRLAAVSVLLLGIFMVSRGVMPMISAAGAADKEIPACHH